MLWNKNCGLFTKVENRLREFGFHGPEAGVAADFVDIDTGFRTAGVTVNWNERVDVVPLVGGFKPSKA